MADAHGVYIGDYVCILFQINIRVKCIRHFEYIFLIYSNLTHRVEFRRPSRPKRCRAAALRTPFGVRGLVTAFGYLGPRGTPLFHGSIVVQNRPRPPAVEEHGVRRQVAQIDEELLVGLLLAVALDFDGDGLRRLAGGEGQRAGLGDVVVVARLGGAVRRCGTTSSPAWS